MTMPFAHHPLAQPASRAGRAAYRRNVYEGWFVPITVVIVLLALGWTLTNRMMAIIAAGG